MSPEVTFLAVRGLAALILYLILAAILITLWRDFRASQQAAGRLPETHLVYGEDPGGPPDSTDAYTPPFPPRPAGDLRTRGDIREPDDQA